MTDLKSLYAEVRLLNLSLKKTAILVILLMASTTVGCTSFRGPGPLQTPVASDSAGGEEEDNEVPAEPTITWNGERKYSKSLPDRGSEAVNFDWPLDEARMTRRFKTGPGKPHLGIDLANKKGTPILAAEKGVVIYTGHGFHGYGNLIIIEHGSEWATMYSHLSKFLVSEGQSVKQGQAIAEMGRTGNASGVHIHFEVRHNRQPVNPLGLLPGGM
jgi:murein DD-endopeptidase MepM/ murein hydrolase activator NlpD